MRNNLLQLASVTALSVAMVCTIAYSNWNATELHWEQTATSLALKSQNHTVWEFHCEAGEMKPVFDPLATPDGRVLTDFRPADHPWHRAAWFCLHSINGVNYWEEDPDTGLSAGRTRVVNYEFRPAADHSAELELDISYAPAGGEEVLVEKRLIRVSAPASDGSYTLDWQLLFTARTDLALQRTPRPEEENGVAWGGYAGLSLRMDPALRGWTFVDSEQRENDSFGKTASWLSFAGALADGSAGLTMFDHPQNLTFPSAWFTDNGMPYFSPAFLFYKPIDLRKGEEIGLCYRIRVDSSLPTTHSLTDEALAFAHTALELSSENAVDLVALGKEVFNTNCEVCHSWEPNSNEVKTGPNLYGAISSQPVWREMMENGKRVKVLGDEQYLRQSLYNPAGRLALQESGTNAGKPYLPLMPSFDRLLSAQQIDGIAAYLLTLNPEGKRGPQQVWAKPHVEAKSSNPHEIVVRDEPLVQRVLISGYSPRSFGVGLTNGFSYIFDPDTCSVRHAWRGGFLNLSGERRGRGTGPNRPARELAIGFEPFLIPRADNGNKIQFQGYATPEGTSPQIMYLMGETLVKQRLNDRGAGSLQYSFECVGGNAPLSFDFDTDKVLTYTCSVGTVKNKVLTLPSKAATTFTVDVQLPPVKSSGASPNLAAHAVGFSNGSDDGSSIGPWGAIDGDPMSWWDENDEQDIFSLRLIFDRRHTFNQLRISGYKHHDFSPKSFQVFVDGSPIAEVTDAVYTKNTLIVDLPKTTGQALELRIHDSYGGSPAIRELEIFHHLDSSEGGQADE